MIRNKHGSSRVFFGVGALIASLVVAACGGTAPVGAAPTTAATAAATAAPTVAPTATPPPYPTKPVNLIVPFAAGGGADIAARLLAPYAAEKWGQPVNVLNVVGASGFTGALQSLQSAPDGYNLFVDSAATSSTAAAVNSQLPFKVEDRAWMGLFARDYFYYLAYSGTPWKTLKEAMESARTNPEAFVWGAAAAGSAVMFVELQLFAAAKVPIERTKMVTFSGGNAPSTQALAGGNVLFGAGDAREAASLSAAGKVRILGASASTRTPDFPDVPSSAELGYQGATFGIWQAVAGPKDTPAYIIKKWEELLAQAAKDPAFLAKAKDLKKIIVNLNANETRKYVIDETQSLLPLASASGVRK